MLSYTLNVELATDAQLDAMRAESEKLLRTLRARYQFLTNADYRAEYRYLIRYHDNTIRRVDQERVYRASQGGCV